MLYLNNEFFKILPRLIYGLNISIYIHRQARDKNTAKCFPVPPSCFNQRYLLFVEYISSPIKFQIRAKNNNYLSLQVKADGLLCQFSFNHEFTASFTLYTGGEFGFTRQRVLKRKFSFREFNNLYSSLREKLQLLSQESSS